MEARRGEGGFYGNDTGRWGRRRWSWREGEASENIEEGREKMGMKKERRMEKGEEEVSFSPLAPQLRCPD